MVLYVALELHRLNHVIISAQNDVVGCAQQVEGLEAQFTARLEGLKNTVQSKTAVPTAHVYVSRPLSLPSPVKIHFSCVTILWGLASQYVGL